MTNIFGSFSQAADASFTANMYSALGEAKLNGNVVTVANALNQAPLDQLSGQERSTLLQVTQQLSSDGVLSGGDAQTITHLIAEFSQQGCGSFDNAWPFPGLSLANMVGNALFNGLTGVLCNILGQSMQDFAFQNTVSGLLDQAGDTAWSGALRGAFENADMSKLNANERSELTAMLSVAVADGDVNWPEAQTILNKLNEAQGCPPECLPGGEAEWSVEHNGSTATIDLGDYTLDINEHSSEMILTNKETGDSSRIWGDPHFDMDNDGQTDVDFWGTMTMNLENGTKITIQTTPWNGNADMTVSSRLVITQGDKAIEVTGMDQNDIGDMEINQSNNGRMMDIFTGDGLDIYENTNGGAWLVQDGFSLREVTQEDMNTTKGEGSDFSLHEALQALTVSVASGALLGLLISMYGSNEN